MTVLSTASNTPPGTERGSGPLLAVLVGAYLMVAVDATVVNVALPSLQRRLHLSPTGLSWVPNAYSLAFGGLLLLGSRIGDRLGRRRTFGTGVLLFTLASLLGGLAPTSGCLLAARALQGVGAALSTPNVLALIATNFPEGRARNRAIGLYSAAASAGASIGLVLGGLLTSWLSWRWSLLINVPIGFAVAAAAPRLLTEPPRHQGSFDVPGAVTGTLGSTALVYGFVQAAQQGFGDRWALAAFAAAAALLAAFVLVELRAADPLLPIELLRDRGRVGAYLNLLLMPAGMFPAFFFLTLVFQQVLHYSALRTGVAFLPMTLAMFATVRLLPGRLGRTGTRPPLIAGALLLLLGGVWLGVLPEHGGYLGTLLGPLLLLGFGAGLSFLPLSVQVLSGVSPARSGAAAGLLQTLQWTGGTVGNAVLVALYGSGLRHGGGSPTHRQVHGLDLAFSGGAAITGLGLLVAVLLIRERGAAAPTDQAAARPADQKVRPSVAR
ncbi:MFS transporter [Kitasatospora sp. LaBMicrA B282]|uniref:MFS transporter n=1 Tax=Kitasatospora sp. LaBMicrA B282 TaxID=3420949 RepID=UPI003D0B664B